MRNCVERMPLFSTTAKVKKYVKRYDRDEVADRPTRQRIRAGLKAILTRQVSGGTRAQRRATVRAEVKRTYKELKELKNAKN